MNTLLVLPILIPLLTAIVALLLWRRPEVQRWISVAGAGALLASAGTLLVTVWRQGIQVAYVANWPAPFGITLVADLLSAIMVVLAGMMGVAVAVYSLGSMDEPREQFGYYPLLHILLMGVSGAFLTGDMFNLYVWFEVMLIASFVLIALGGTRSQLEGAIKYVTLNLLSSALFLAAVGILYGVAGTLNMADLAVRLPQVAAPGLLTVLAMLFVVAFGIKAAAFPLFFWLPASYHTPPVAVSAIFAGLLTKVGVYAMLRVFTLIFVHDVGYTHLLLLVIAGATMVTGVLGAVAQNDIRRILSFHIVSQIGYMLMGVGLMVALASSDSAVTRAGVALALTGSIFYIMHHIIVKTTLFLVGGVVERLHGTGNLKQLGGLYAAKPALAVLFLLPALSLAGIPPLSGFWAKLTLIRAGLELQQYVIAGVALAVGLLTLFSMTKIWGEVFWKAAPSGDATVLERTPAAMIAPIVVLVACTVTIGLAAEPVFTLASAAAEQLLEPAGYVQAVLGDAAVVSRP